MIKKLLLIFLGLAFITFSAIAQEKKDSVKAMNWKDVAQWRYIPSFGVQQSADGKWIAYPTVRTEGDGTVTVQQLNDTTKYVYQTGGSSMPLSGFSENGQWFAYLETPNFKEQKAAEKSKKPVYNKLHLISLKDNKDKVFDRATNFRFNGPTSDHLAIEVARPTGGNPGSGRDILLVHLPTGTVQNIGNTGEFAFNKKGNWLAYTISADQKLGNGLYLMNLADRKLQVLDNDTADYRRLNWTEDKDALTVLKMSKDKDFKKDKGQLVAVKNISNPNVLVYNPFKDSLHFPKGMTISGMRTPYWSDDLSQVIFGINSLEAVKKEMEETDTKKDSVVKDLTEAEKLAKLKADTSIKSLDDLRKAIAKAEAKPEKKATAKNEADKPDMVIWHWQDKRLQSRQQVLENQDKNFSYLASWNPASNKFSQLNDSTRRSIRVLPKEKYAIVEDIDEYELDQWLDGQSYKDIYITNLQTGEKHLFRKKFYQPSFSSNPNPSPDGNKFVYGDDGHYFVYDIPARKSTNITANVNANFVDEEDDHNVTKPMDGVMGWSADGRYVLLSDGWSIWQFDASRNYAATELTPGAGASKIRYLSRLRLDPDEKGFDPSKDQYFRAYGENTKKSGIAILKGSKNGLVKSSAITNWDDAQVNVLGKAKNSDSYLLTKSNFNKPTTVFSTGASLANPAELFNTAPDAKKYQWSEGSRLVNYVSDKGDSLQGVLYLPAGYEAGKKYPTIVYYYEKLSQNMHSYSNPSYPGGGWNPTMYTSNGYAVFTPDIVYKLDDPGMSAVWCVIPGVKAAIATGVIDENNIGITGHSWGGYQTSFLITQTNMFKAAAAGAPLTDLVSMYNLIYWNSGSGNMSIFEASQGRFRGAPWENWEAYNRNSPLYHVKKVQTPLLLLHNDKDGAVDFTQGIEYYNALRRLKKPVVMIQYKGENHGLAKLENRKDYAVRMMEFFDHYLKGKPAADWWSNGIDHLNLEEHLEKRAY